MIDRRTVLLGAAGLTVYAAAGPKLVLAAAAAGADEDAALAALLQRHSEAYLRRSPEAATAQEFDVGDHAGLRSRLDDRSLAAVAINRAAVRQGLAELREIKRDRLSFQGGLDYDTAHFVYTTLDDQLARYGVTDINLRPSPYVVSQMNGSYYWLPDFIGVRHPLVTAADGEAYLARLAALGPALDQESERIAHDAGLGVIPPDFVLERTLAQLTTLRDTPFAQSTLVRSALRRAEENGLGDYRGKVARIMAESVAPALTRQIAALAALRPKARDTAGVWHLPDGEAYYVSAARSNTTTAIPPAELHRLGLDEVARLTAEIDRSLKANGYGRGTVGERIDALNRDPRFQVSMDDAGREEILAEARAQIARIEAKLPGAFSNRPVKPVVVRRVPAQIEDGAPGAFYTATGPDEPGIYSLNLKSPEDLPSWRLPTLTHHESIPGHHLQYSTVAAAGGLSLFRRIVRFSAYAEGWALYGEQVADELAIYGDDPFGRIGFLQSQLFRAARIVVDTGLHHLRWSRQEAIRWMVERIGEPVGAATREIDRYCVYPGQACSFKVGQNQIVAARERARARLGARFDLRQFHDLILRSGPLPMEVLAAMVDHWARSLE